MAGLRLYALHLMLLVYAIENAFALPLYNYILEQTGLVDHTNGQLGVDMSNDVDDINKAALDDTRAMTLKTLTKADRVNTLTDISNQNRLDSEVAQADHAKAMMSSNDATQQMYQEKVQNDIALEESKSRLEVSKKVASTVKKEREQLDQADFLRQALGLDQPTTEKKDSAKEFLEELDKPVKPKSKKSKSKKKKKKKKSKSDEENDSKSENADDTEDPKPEKKKKRKKSGKKEKDLENSDDTQDPKPEKKKKRKKAVEE